MFITYEELRSPAAGLLAGGEDGWTGVELALEAPWFIVSFAPILADEKTPGWSHFETMLYSQVSDVESIVRWDSRKTVHHFEIHVVTPRHLNLTQHWKTERLVAVWTAEDPESQSKVTLLEVKGGTRYPEMVGHGYGRKFGEAVLRFKVPTIAAAD